MELSWEWNRDVSFCSLQFIVILKEDLRSWHMPQWYQDTLLCLGIGDHCSVTCYFFFFDPVFCGLTDSNLLDLWRKQIKTEPSSWPEVYSQGLWMIWKTVSPEGGYSPWLQDLQVPRIKNSHIAEKFRAHGRIGQMWATVTLLRVLVHWRMELWTSVLWLDVRMWCYVSDVMVPTDCHEIYFSYHVSGLS